MRFFISFVPKFVEQKWGTWLIFIEIVVRKSSKKD